MKHAPRAGDNYEELVDVLSAMEPAPSGSRRSVHWTGINRVVGLSRDPQGRIEIFIAGPELRCASDVLAANLAFNLWEGEGGHELRANRLRLPAEPHYDAIAAFLCTHLLDNGTDDNSQAGFTRSEPVIEIAFERSRLQSEALIGLCGELLVLRALLDRRPAHALEIFASWEGYGRSARDFHLQAVGIEVKTTRGSNSWHRVQGVRQVEIGHGRQGHPETALYLVSIGIDAPEEGAGGHEWSLPGLVDSILLRAEAAIESPGEYRALATRFLAQVRTYGSAFGEGYDHREMRNHVLFGTRFRTAFVRAYDMGDPAITVLRASDLVSFGMVDPQSVEFAVDLPPVVHGDINPVQGLTAATTTIATRAWG